MKHFSFIFLLTIGCAPSVDSPNTISSDLTTIDYPSNWKASATGSVITVEERLVLGQVPSDTFIYIVPINERVAGPMFDQEREVHDEVAGEDRIGTLWFSWDDDKYFYEQYCFHLDSTGVCVQTQSDSKSIERARPGIDLIYETLRVTGSTSQR